MNKEITQAEFEALANDNTVESETDVEYSYESVIDENGTELAYAAHHAFNGSKFYLQNA